MESSERSIDHSPQHETLVDRARKMVSIKCGWERLARLIAKYAPCFWCNPSFMAGTLLFWKESTASSSGGHHNDIALTDRAVLYRLTILCSFFAAGQVLFGIYLSVVYLVIPDCQSSTCTQSYIPNLWNPLNAVLGLTIIGLVLFGASLNALKIIRNVDILGALRYYWVLQWISPFEALFVFNLFDYHQVTKIFVTHWWHTEAFDWFRKQFCSDEDFNAIGNQTEFNNLSLDDFCICNTTTGELVNDACYDTREEAIDDMTVYSTIFFTTNFVWGLVFVIVLFLTTQMLEFIIGIQLVQKSKERNLSFWLTLPISACFFSGYAFIGVNFDDQVVSEELKWISITYYLSCGTFALVAFLGWYLAFTSVLDSSDKKRKEHASILFIMACVVTIACISAIMVVSIVFSTFASVTVENGERRGRMACELDKVGSCSNCDGEDDNAEICPEWTSTEVKNVLSAILKQNVIVAAILLIYALESLRYGIKMRTHITSYQVAYV
mmetsp:Transcript_21013/g.31352  ORF Transcript_21013/g.31352 Transcript_21013/m.31352 type:complete len:496 (-) Transcript_21013:52-1539(-)